MITKQQIKDYLRGRIIRKIDPSRDDSRYWVGYVRAGLFADYGNYVGKYKIHRTFDEIDELVPHLIELLKAGKMDCFKHKSRETPIDPEYADKLPPLFVYLTKKQRPRIEEDLDRLRLEDRVWIDDTRTALDFERENIELARKLGMDFNGRYFIPLEGGRK